MDYDSEQARIRRMLEEVEREWEVNDENQFQSDSGGEEDHIEVEEFHPQSDLEDSNTDGSELDEYPAESSKKLKIRGGWQGKDKKT